VSQGLKVNGREVREAADAIVRLGMPEARQALSCLASAIAAASPSRRGMHLIAVNFGQWLSWARPGTRAAFFEALPRVAPRAGQLRAEGVRQLLNAANAFEASDQCGRLLACAGTYGLTDGRIILAVSRIAKRALEWGAEEYLQRLLATVPAERTTDSRDAKRLLPALARLSDVAGEQSRRLWSDASEIILTLAARNHSSAYVVARDLPKRLQSCRAGLVSAYVEDFRKLAEAIGIRMVGFGLNELPTLYDRYGEEHTRRFVSAAASAAHDYGVTAAQWFWEQKTTAARQLLQGEA